MGARGKGGFVPAALFSKSLPQSADRLRLVIFYIYPNYIDNISYFYYNNIEIYFKFTSKEVYLMKHKLICMVLAICVTCGAALASAEESGYRRWQFFPFAASSAAGLADGQSISAMEAELVRQVNQERARYGAPALKVDAQLSAAALVRAKEIVEKFSHTRPDGTRGITVSEAARAENLAKGQQSVDKVMAAWLTSSGHRRAMLSASYQTTGVAVCKSGGVFYWVELFGR